MNPQVSVAFALTGDLAPLSLPAYLLGQFLGAGAAALLVLVLYLDTLTPAALAAMATSPGVTQSTFPLVSWFFGFCNCRPFGDFLGDSKKALYFAHHPLFPR